MKENLSTALQIAILALQTGVILFAARTAGEIARKYRIPPVLGELFAGILIGPYLLGKLPLGLHGLEKGLFPLLEGNALPVSLSLYSLATIGSIILLFLSGLETDLRQFFRYSVTGTLVGVGGALVSFLAGDLLGIAMFHCSFMDPRCLFLGILCTATSVGITARILSEKKAIDSPEGTTIMAAAVIDDVLGIICLAVVMGIVGVSGMKGASVDWGHIGMIAVKSIGIWLGITALGLCFAHKIAGFLKLYKSSVIFSSLALALALLLAGIFEQAGLAMIVGAYVMGLALSKTDIAFSIHRNLEGVSNFLVPIFFVVMGMLVDVRVFSNMEVLKYGFLYSLLAIIAKIVGCALPAYCLNFNLLGSIRIGMGMIPRGEVALIIAGIGASTMMVLSGKKVPIINPELFGIAIIMTLVTTVAAPPLLSFVLSLKKSGVRHPVKDDESVHLKYKLPSENIREFVLRSMEEQFRNEGYRHSPLDRDGGLINFRRATRSFTLQINDNELDFAAKPSECSIIRSVLNETFIEVKQTMRELEEFSSSDSVKALHTDIEANTDSRALPRKWASVLTPEHIMMDLQSETVQDAIKEMTFYLAKHASIQDPERCLQDILAREKAFSTCMPGGIAMPHARTKAIGSLRSIIGISRKGCTSDKPEVEKVHILVMSLCPPEFNNPYLQYVSHIAGVLAKKENIAQILQAKTQLEVFQVFAGKKERA